MIVVNIIGWAVILIITVSVFCVCAWALVRWLVGSQDLEDRVEKLEEKIKEFHKQNLSKDPSVQVANSSKEEQMAYLKALSLWITFGSSLYNCCYCRGKDCNICPRKIVFMDK